MRRIVWKLAIFLVVLLAFAWIVDLGASAGLKRSQSVDYAVWNDIMQGKATSNVLIVGSSRAQNHFSPEVIGGALSQSCYDLGIPAYGLDMQIARYDLYREHNGKPKLVVMSVDDYSFTRRADLFDNNQFLPYIWNPDVWAAIQPYHYYHSFERWVPLLRYRGRGQVILSGWGELLGVSHSVGPLKRGFAPYPGNWVGGFQQWLAEHPTGRATLPLQQDLVKRLDQFMAQCQQERIPVVLVYSPEYYEVQQRLDNRPRVLGTYQQLADKYGVPFLNYSDSPISHNIANFHDWAHLNAVGSKIFSQQFAQELVKLVAAKGWNLSYSGNGELLSGDARYSWGSSAF